MASLQAGGPPAVGLLSASKETVLSNEGSLSAGVKLKGVIRWNSRTESIKKSLSLGQAAAAAVFLCLAYSMNCH